MINEITWSPRAASEYEKLLDYLIEAWGEKVAIEFSLKFENILESLMTMPFLYPPTLKRKNVRRCVITKQTTLYYRIKKSRIELITLFDTRQNPTKKKIK